MKPTLRSLVLVLLCLLVLAANLHLQAQQAGVLSQAAQPTGLAPKSFSIIGDSRAANLYVSVGVPTTLSSYQWFNWANDINGHNMLLIANYGISGYRSDQFLNSNLQAALADSAETLIFNSPAVNDIGQCTTPYTNLNGVAVSCSNVASVAAGNVKAAAAQAVAAGKRVILVGETGNTAFTTTSQVGPVLEVNERLRDFAEQTRGVYYFDPTIDLWNPTTSTTAIAFKTGVSQDGLHPNTLGSYYIGQHFASWIQSLVPYYEFRPCSITDNSTNTAYSYMTNPLFNTLTGGTKQGTGTITGNVPSGFRISAGANASSAITVTSAADPAGCGNDVTLAMTVTAADTLNIAYVPPSFSLGDIFQTSVDVSVASGSSNFTLALQPQVVVTGTTTASISDLLGTSYGSFPTTAYSLHMQTIPYLIPSTGTPNYINDVLYFTFSGAGSATVTLSRWDAKKRFQ